MTHPLHHHIDCLECQINFFIIKKWQAAKAAFAALLHEPQARRVRKLDRLLNAFHARVQCEESGTRTLRPVSNAPWPPHSQGCETHHEVQGAQVAVRFATCAGPLNAAEVIVLETTHTTVAYLHRRVVGDENVANKEKKK